MTDFAVTDSVDAAAAAVAAFEALLTAAGSDLLAAASAAFARGQELAVGERLRAAGHPPDLVAAAFAQAELRARASAKFTRADRMFFTRAGLEQASSERAARHRAARFAGRDRLADLCAGIGGDLLALAEDHPVLAVDRDPLHLRMAAHNARVQDGVEIETRLADVRDVDLTAVDGVFVDPARRSGDQRLSAGSGEPALEWCFGLVERVGAVAVKAAPGLPLDLVPPGWEIEFVADRRQLKESVLFSPALATASRRATVLLGPADGPDGGPDGGPADSSDGGPADGSDDKLARGSDGGPVACPAGESDTGPGGASVAGPDTRLIAKGGPARVVTLTGEPDPGTSPAAGSIADGSGDRGSGRSGAVAPLPVRPPGEYLCDPNPAVTRAGLVGTLGRLVGGWQIDPRIAFLGLDRPVVTPFARVLRVEAEMPFDVRRVAAAVRAAGIGALDVRRRGLAGDVETIRRRLLPPRRHLVPGGRTLTVVMTRVRDEPWALLCSEVAPHGRDQASSVPRT